MKTMKISVAIALMSGLVITAVGSIEVFGRVQLTYNGWPLYYFGQDGQTRGFNKGISFPTPGVWPVPGPGFNQAPQ